MGEFELIRRHFAGLAPDGDGIILGIGDDAAILDVPPDRQLVVTADTLVAGRHFPERTAAADIGWKSLAVNLSDLAAMGAEARWLTLALSLPRLDDAWAAGFSQGFGELARSAGVALVGGDITRGPLTISVTAMGLVPRACALRRSGARAERASRPPAPPPSAAPRPPAAARPAWARERLRGCRLRARPGARDEHVRRRGERK